MKSNYKNLIKVIAYKVKKYGILLKITLAKFREQMNFRKQTGNSDDAKKIACAFDKMFY
jgi:hypothetical protein